MNKTIRKYASVFVGSIMAMGSILPTFAETTSGPLSADVLINNDTGKTGVKVKKGETFSMKFTMSPIKFFNKYKANYEVFKSSDMLKFNDNKLEPRVSISIPLQSDLFDTSAAEVKLEGRAINAAFTEDGLNIDQKYLIDLDKNLNNQYDTAYAGMRALIGTDDVTLEISGLKLTDEGQNKKSINVSVNGMIQMNANAHVENYTFPETAEEAEQQIAEQNDDEEIKYIDYIFADGDSADDAMNEAQKHANFNFQRIYGSDGEEAGLRLWYTDAENVEIAGNYNMEDGNRVDYVIRTKFLIVGNAMQMTGDGITEEIPSIEILPENDMTPDVQNVKFNFYDLVDGKVLEDHTVSIDVDRAEVRRTGKPVDVKDLMNSAIASLEEDGYQLSEGNKEVTGQVWVVDQEAWDEVPKIPAYICNQCGWYSTNGADASDMGIHIMEAHGGKSSYHTGYIDGEVIHHEEEGHYEEKVVGQGIPSAISGDIAIYTLNVEHRIDEETDKDKATFTRQINYVDESGKRLGGGKQEVTSDVVYVRNKDAVTGEVINERLMDTDIMFEGISDFSNVKIPGYTVKEGQEVLPVSAPLSDLLASGETELEPVNIVFVKNQKEDDPQPKPDDPQPKPEDKTVVREVKITYVDADENKPQDLSEYNETIKVNGVERDGEFMPDKSVPTNCESTLEKLKDLGYFMEGTAPSSVNGSTAEYKVTLKHSKIGASTKDRGTIDRKITLAFSDTGKKETVTQKLSTAAITSSITDKVTNDVIKSSKEYTVTGEAFKLPAREGYTPKIPSLPPLNISGTSEEILKPEQYAMTIPYTKNETKPDVKPVKEMNIKIMFKDTSSDPKDLSSKTITFTEKDGLSKDKMKAFVNDSLKALKNAGYEITDKSSLDALKYEGKETATVILGHAQSKTEETINIGKNDSNNKYARKIILRFDDKDPVTVNQYGDAVITRTTIKDMVTGKTITKNTIQKLSFDELKIADLPEAKGYKTDAVAAKAEYNGPFDSTLNISNVTAELKKDTTPAKSDEQKEEGKTDDKTNPEDQTKPDGTKPETKPADGSNSGQKDNQKGDSQKTDGKKDSSKSDSKKDNSQKTDQKAEQKTSGSSSSQNASPKEGANSGSKTGVGSPVVAIAVGAAALIGLGAIFFFTRRTKPEDEETSEDAGDKAE